MIVESILIAVITFLTTVFTQIAMKALHCESKCGKCIDIVIDTDEPREEQD